MIPSRDTLTPLQVVEYPVQVAGRLDPEADQVGKPEFHHGLQRRVATMDRSALRVLPDELHRCRREPMFEVWLGDQPPTRCRATQRFAGVFRPFSNITSARGRGRPSSIISVIGRRCPSARFGPDTTLG